MEMTCSWAGATATACSGRAGMTYSWAGSAMTRWTAGRAMTRSSTLRRGFDRCSRGGADEFLAGRAVREQGAFVAARLAGLADGSAVVDQEVGPEGPVLLGDDRDQVLFDLDG